MEVKLSTKNSDIVQQGETKRSKFCMIYPRILTNSKKPNPITKWIGFSNTLVKCRWIHGFWDGTFSVTIIHRGFKSNMKIHVISHTIHKVMVVNATPYE